MNVTVPPSRPRAACDPLSQLWCVRGEDVIAFGLTLEHAYDNWRHELRLRAFYAVTAPPPAPALPARWWLRWPAGWALWTALAWLVSAVALTWH